MDQVQNIGMARRSDIHFMRRFWHILVGTICLFLYYYFHTSIMLWGEISLGIAIFGFLIDFYRLKNESLNLWLSKNFGPLMRRSEKLSFSGLPFYALGVGLSILFYESHIAILSILFLIYADPIASIIGVKFGRERLLPNKTLQGTLAAFLTALLIAIVYLAINKIHSPNIILFCFLGAIAAAISELMSSFNIDDNLTIPVVSGLFLTLLNLWLDIF